MYVQFLESSFQPGLESFISVPSGHLITPIQLKAEDMETIISSSSSEPHNYNLVYILQVIPHQIFVSS